MSGQALLLWMSARRSGSWDQFRGAVEDLHLTPARSEAEFEDDADSDQAGWPVYRYYRFSFESLAHAEFFTHGCEKGWRIAPPTLALHASSDTTATAILCGARSPRMLAAIPLIATRASVIYTQEALPNAPDVVRVVGPPDSLAMFAQEIGAVSVPNAPLAILSTQVPIHERCFTPGGVLPEGKDCLVQAFDPLRLRWCVSSQADASQHLGRSALFRCRLPYDPRPHYFLRLRSGLYPIRGAVGKYILLRHYRRKVLTYRRASQHLVVPAVCRPPLLIDRALTLCSGRLPNFDGSNLSYLNIPPDVARLTGSLLHQEVKLYE